MDARLVVRAGLVADGEQGAVGRKAVVVVAFDGGAGVKQLRRAVGERQFVNPAFAVEEKILSVARPVRCFDVIAGVVSHAAVGGRDGHGFQRAFQRGRHAGWRGNGRQLDVGKNGLFNGLIVVRANAEADIKIGFDWNLQISAGGFQFPAHGCDPHGNVIAAFFQPHANRRGDIRLDFVRHRAVRFAVLQRRQPAAVNRDIRVSRTGLQRLTDEQTGFAVWIAARAEEADAGREREIARHFFPDEMERVIGEPDIGTAASDEVFAFGRVKIRRAGFKDAANVGLPGKNTRFGSAKNEACIHG